MDEQTVDYNLEEVVTGTAESIIAKLADIGTEDLAKLRALEEAMPKPRSTVLAAINAELDGRGGDLVPVGEAQNAAEETLQAAFAAQAGKIEDLTHRNEILEAIVNALSEGLHNRELLAAGESYVLVEKVFAVIDGQAAEIAKATAAATRTSVPKAPKPVAIGQADALPDLAGVGEVRVICVGEDEKSLPALPLLVFQPYQFTIEGDRLVLNEPIAFGNGLPATEVHAFYAVPDGAKKGLRAALVQPINVGGGTSMEVPKGHLGFAAVAEPKG